MSNRPAAWLGRLKIDGYLLLIVGAAALASVLPARGESAAALGWTTKIGIAVVFFLHGARLSRDAVIAGLVHWRLHLVVLSVTYGFFPLLCLALSALPASVTPEAMVPGLIFLGCLPSTIQASIAMTAVARGNVPAAVAAASFSNVLGVFLTPLLVGLLLHHVQGQGPSLQSIQPIIAQLLLPFVAGHLLRPWIGEWVSARAKQLGNLDRATIIMVVYTAFGAAVVAGLWTRVGAADLAKVAALCGLLLSLSLLTTWALGRLLGFDRADRVAIVMCGSKKSLATAAPMASVLFPAASAGLAILPVMIFHQIQLMTCTAIAQAWAKRDDKRPESG